MRNRLTLPCLLLLMFAAACLLRSIGLMSLAPNPDELMHMSIANADTLGGVWQRGLYETHPPLGHVLRHFTLALTEDAAHERVLSLIFGLLCIPLWYAIGRRLGGHTGGLMLAMIATLSPLMVVASQEVRNYALFMLFASAAFYSYLRYSEHPHTRGLLCFTALLALACATHFTGFIVAAIIGCTIAWHRRHALRQLWPVIAAYLPIGALGIAFYALFFAEGTLAKGWHDHYVSIGKHYATSTHELITTIIKTCDVLGIGNAVETLTGFAHAPLLAGGISLAVMFIGWKKLRHTHATAARLVVIFAITAPLLSLAALYPLTPSRHSVYAVMFMALPFACLLPDTRRVQMLLTGIGLALATIYGTVAWRTQAHDTLAFTTTDMKRLAYGWADHTPGEAPIIVNRFTSLYLDAMNDGGRTFYNGDTPRIRTIGSGHYITDATLYRWGYDADRLRAVIAAQEAREPTAAAWTFLYINRFGWDMEPFHLCVKAAGDVEYELRAKGFTLFTLSREAPSLSRCIDTVRERP